MNIIIRQVLKFLITSVLLTALQNLLKKEVSKRLVPKVETGITGLFNKFRRKKGLHKVEPLSEEDKENLKDKKKDIIDM